MAYPSKLKGLDAWSQCGNAEAWSQCGEMVGQGGEVSCKVVRVLPLRGMEARFRVGGSLTGGYHQEKELDPKSHLLFVLEHHLLSHQDICRCVMVVSGSRGTKDVLVVFLLHAEFNQSLISSCLSCHRGKDEIMLFKKNIYLKRQSWAGVMV